MPRWSASSSWQRRPCGPSATLTDSRPSRGMPLSCQKLRPEHSDAACGDSVIVSEAACGACDSDARTYVQYPPPTPPRPPRLRRLRYMLHAGGWYAGALTHGARRSLVTDVHVNAARRPPPGSSGPPGPPQARQAPRASRAHPDPAEQATWVGPRRRQVAFLAARRVARRVGGSSAHLFSGQQHIVSMMSLEVGRMLTTDSVAFYPRCLQPGSSCKLSV